MAALTAGAAGYLTKDAAHDDIRRAVEAAVAGQSVLDPVGRRRRCSRRRTGRRGARRPAWPSMPDGLTDREAEVLALIAAGRSNTEIAERLYVAEATVKTHVNRIFAKTNSRDRAQAAVYAHRHGLADGDAPSATAAGVESRPPPFQRDTPSMSDGHEQDPEVGETAKHPGRATHLHELAHDDPDLDQGEADGAHGHDRARGGNSLMRGRMIDPQVGQRNGDQDQPHPEEPLVEPVLHHHLTT